MVFIWYYIIANLKEGFIQQTYGIFSSGFKNGLLSLKNGLYRYIIFFRIFSDVPWNVEHLVFKIQNVSIITITIFWHYLQQNFFMLYQMTDTTIRFQ